MNRFYKKVIKWFSKIFLKRILQNIISMQEKTTFLPSQAKCILFLHKNIKHYTLESKIISQRTTMKSTGIFLLTPKIPLSLQVKIHARSKIIKFVLEWKSKGYTYSHYTDHDIWLKLSVLWHLRYPRRFWCTQFTETTLFIQFLIWKKNTSEVITCDLYNNYGNCVKLMKRNYVSAFLGVPKLCFILLSSFI